MRIAMNKVVLTFKFNIGSHNTLEISKRSAENDTIVSFFYLSRVMKPVFKRNS